LLFTAEPEPAGNHQQGGKGPVGLYLNIGGWLDSVELRLPLAIGARGFARTGDDALFGENPEMQQPPRAKDVSNSVYQPGFNHIRPGAGVMLEDVLRRWLFMVTEGLWQVDEQGVSGGIDMFKEADASEKWQHYQIKRWF
jgi:hypothetical protein